MRINFKISVRQWHSIVCVVFMAGCSFAGSGIRPEYGGTADNLATDSTNFNGIKLITSQLLANEKVVREKESTSDITHLMSQPIPYTIESNDVISIIVWDHPELGGNGTNIGISTTGAEPRSASSPALFTVDHQGLIQFPYVGMIKIAGLTEDSARTLLSSRLAHYINKPNITLNVQSFRSKRIYVDGEVKSPGVLPITDIPMTLVEAINRAGGFLPAADQSQIALSRDGATYRINLPHLVQRGINPADVILKNGDVIRARSRDESKVFISGEVIGPRALLMHNGKLSLNEALGESGGINPISGDSRQVYVVRRAGTVPVVYRLNAHSPDAMALAEGFELEPKDIVYVAATPLANWQRTISQLLPGGLSPSVSTLIPPR